MAATCPYAKHYKGVRYPRCGCKACWKKWHKENRRRLKG